MRNTRPMHHHLEISNWRRGHARDWAIANAMSDAIFLQLHVLSQICLSPYEASLYDINLTPIICMRH